MTDKLITLEPTVISLYENRKYNTLKDILVTLNPADISFLLEKLPEHALPLLFRLLPKEVAAETFVEMESDFQEILIKGFSDAELKAMLDELYVDDTVDIIEEMPANVVKRILSQTDPQTRKEINVILRYPEDSAGSIMTTEFVELKADMTIKVALDHIRKTATEKETINVCYVTDNSRHLVGFLSLRTIILSKDDALIGDLMDSNVISVGTLEDQEKVAEYFDKYDFIVIPVVDKDNRLVGIVTVDDALDVLKEEATEDISKIAAITPSDKPYLKTSVFEIFKGRIPWLLLLMISSTFTGMIITHFENALAAQVTLTAFIPMLMGTGGNSGSQSSVTVIRSLSLNELDFKDIAYVIWKEIRVAVLCGLTLAVCNYPKLLIVDRVTSSIAIVICVALAFTVFVAKLVGCTLPMIAKKVGFDPTVMASPLITTIVDAISLLIYFAVATSILGL